jgi:hypothetical protein
VLAVVIYCEELGFPYLLYLHECHMLMKISNGIYGVGHVRALVMGLMLHSKARSLLQQNLYDEALEVLAMAEVY